jgi:ATP-dependent DNA helicase PIF1
MFITGEGGCGKSYLAWQLYDFALTELKWDPEHIAVTAYTGVAAQELLLKKTTTNSAAMPRGVTTLHSFMGMQPNIKTMEQLLDVIEHTPVLRARWTGTFLLIIDEVSMVDAGLFAILYEMRARFNSRMVIVCLGDFCQLPPQDKSVRNSHTGNYEMIPDFCFQSPAWRSLIGSHVITLTTNHRVENDREWRKLLVRIRLGHHMDVDKRTLLAMRSGPERPITPEHVHIYCRRRQVKQYNEEYFDKLTTDGRCITTYPLQWQMCERIVNPRSKTPLSTTLTVDAARADLNFKDFLLKLVGDSPGRPDNDLLAKEARLCVGARIIYDRNMLDQGLGNGMQGTIVTMASDSIEVLFDGQTEPIKVGYVEHTELSEYLMIAGHSTQFKVTCLIMPVQLAGAVTVHKAQGMTLDKVYVKLYDVDNGKPYSTIDFPGQVYVALSRGRMSANIIVDSLLETDWKKVTPHPAVITYYSELSGVTTQPTERPRTVWGHMLNPRWIQRNILVTETPLFIIYKRYQVYVQRLNEEADEKRLKKDAKRQKRS